MQENLASITEEFYLIILKKVAKPSKLIVLELIQIHIWHNH